MNKKPTISFYIPEVLSLISQLETEKTENCIFIALDSSLKLLARYTATSASQTQVSLDSRSLITTIITPQTRFICLLHNHPSGKSFPSAVDYKTTLQLVSLGELLNFTVLDHIIVTTDSYFSFAEEGILNDLKNRFF